MEGIKTLFQHPFFKGIVETEDTDYKDRREAIRKEQAELHKRIDSLLATLNGEDKWMLTLSKKDKGDAD